MHRYATVLKMSLNSALKFAELPGRIEIRKDAFRWLVLGGLFSLAMFREFDSPDGPASLIYGRAFSSFRWVDLLLLAIVLATIVLSRPRDWRLPRSVAWPALVFACAIVFAIFFGQAHGGYNIFFDWRGIALGAGLVMVFSDWVRTSFALKSAVNILILVVSVRAVWILFNYVAGGGVDTVLLGVRTPFYDGATLSISGLVGLLALRLSQEEHRLLRKLVLILGGLLGYLLVLVCFRRTFWGELFIATVILVVLKRKGRRIVIAGGVVTLILAAAIVPGVFIERIRSIEFDSTASEFSDTNLDHLNDILDAWDQITERPITGLGLGYPYQTARIRAWKEESWEVHNAPIHVWLRYGLLGLISYLWYHIALFRWVRGFKNSPDRWVRAFAQVCFAYMVGQFIVPLGFSPWPYGGLQSCILLAFLMGSLFALQAYDANASLQVP